MSEKLKNGEGNSLNLGVAACYDASALFSKPVGNFNALKNTGICADFTTSAPAIEAEEALSEDLCDFSKEYNKSAKLLEEAMDILTEVFRERAKKLYLDSCAELTNLDFREVVDYMNMCGDYENCWDSDNCDCDNCANHNCEWCTTSVCNEATHKDDNHKVDDEAVYEIDNTDEDTVTEVSKETITVTEASEDTIEDDIINPDAPLYEKVEIVYAYTFGKYMTFNEAPTEVKKAIKLLREAHTITVKNCTNKLQEVMLNNFNSLPPSKIYEYYSDVGGRATLIALVREMVDPDFK